MGEGGGENIERLAHLVLTKVAVLLGIARWGFPGYL